MATLADSWQLVCGDCVIVHEPQLLAVLGLVEASEDVSLYLLGMVELVDSVGWTR